MRTLEKYVLTSFLSSFTLSFLVLSFVLTIGLMVQIVGYILDGIEMKLIGDFALVSFPETMQWTIPLALLTSGVLVFSRMSADSEISAMRSCGVNIIAVMKWPLVFGALCTLLGAWINNEIVPRGHEVRRNLKAKVSVSSGLEVLEPGTWIDEFPKVKLYFAKKDGNWLYDLMAFDYSNPKFDRMIRASKALVTEKGRDIVLDLRNLSVDPLDEEHPGMMKINRYQYVVKDALKSTTIIKKDKDRRLKELCAHIEKLKGELSLVAKDPDSTQQIKDIKRQICRAKVEFSKRFVFALASICFVFIGIPLGIRSQRKESSIGMAISLAVSLGYYMIIMLMLSLQKSYAIHPEILIYLPVAICAIIACYLVKKHL